MKRCTDCKYAVLVDYGYSNWTVEGTSVHCAKKLHPKDGYDHWYGKNEDSKYAEQCAEFVHGSSINIDVDGDAIDDLSEEELAIYHMVFPKSR